MRHDISDQFIQVVHSIARKHSAVIAVYLFGSVSRGEGRKDSDIDIGFLCGQKTDLDPREVSVTLDRLVTGSETDVVVCDLTESPLLLSRILRGRVLYQKSTNARAFLERRILKLYDDYRHLQSIGYHYLKRSFMEGIYAHR